MRGAYDWQSYMQPQATGLPDYTGGMGQMGQMGGMQGGLVSAIGQAHRGLGNIVGDIFGMSQPSPYGVYAKGISGIPSTMHQYLDPYIQQGQKVMPELSGQYEQLAMDPSAQLQRFGSQYHESPGYKFRVQEAIDAANRGAAASGRLGLPATQSAIAERVGGLADQDYQQYLGNVMGLYGRGLAGLGGLEQQGMQASGTLAEALSQQQEREAQARAAQQAQKSKGLSGLIGDIFSFI